MRCLLDTHTYLWAVDDDRRLSHRASDIIEDDSNELVLSIASLWEIAIKLGTGKLQIRGPFRELALVTPATRGVSLLSITPEHLDQVLQLPLHHRDPFDRMLIAQCIADDMSIISRDGALDRYEVERIW